MCYASPGPRCSSHARQKVNSLQSKIDDSKQNISDLKFKENSLVEQNKDNPTQKNDKALASLRKKINKEEAKVRHYFAEKKEADKAYNTTPEGQNVLQQKIRNAKAKGDTKMVNHYTTQLNRGIAKRSWSMSAHKRIQASKKSGKTIRQIRGNFITFSDRSSNNTELVHDEEFLKAS